MNEREAEDVVRHFLEGHNRRCVVPSKPERRSGQTPDFRGYHGEDLCFFAEVKSLRGDDPVDLALSGIDPVETAVIFRNDPTFNRITTAIHKAVQQFDRLNADREHPNVLALVNYEQICGLHDLRGVLTGQFYADDGTRDRIYSKYSDGRMAKDALKVDLYLWMDPNDPDGATFVYTSPSSHRLRLCHCSDTIRPPFKPFERDAP